MARARKRQTGGHRARGPESSPRRGGPVGRGGRARDWAARLVQVFGCRALGFRARREVRHRRVAVGWRGGRAAGVVAGVAGGAEALLGELVGRV